MRFHVIGLPHTQTTSEYVHCAYTSKVRKFCNMMTDRGHEVLLYAGDQNEARVKELITCITRKEQEKLIGIKKSTDNLKARFNPEESYWKLMNKRAIKAMKKRIEKKDFICLIGGLCQKEIADAFPNHISVEYGIGYSGTFAKYRVFESYAWMHTIYGAQQGADQANGNFYDAVIPNYYEIDKFPLCEKPDDYFFFIGRLIDRKGWGIAQEVCEKLGKRLVVAGQGEFSGYGEYVGVVNEADRGILMSHAQAVFVPTRYIGPFEGVHAEAMLCGTPVITTDFGVFTETVTNDVNGFRCSTLAEFMAATENVAKLNRRTIRSIAQSEFSTKNIAIKYEDYFTKLLTLWDKGWYS